MVPAVSQGRRSWSLAYINTSHGQGRLISPPPCVCRFPFVIANLLVTSYSHFSSHALRIRPCLFLIGSRTCLIDPSPRVEIHFRLLLHALSHGLCPVDGTGCLQHQLLRNACTYIIPTTRPRPCFARLVRIGRLNKVGPTGRTGVDWTSLIGRGRSLKEGTDGSMGTRWKWTIRSLHVWRTRSSSSVRLHSVSVRGARRNEVVWRRNRAKEEVRSDG